MTNHPVQSRSNVTVPGMKRNRLERQQVTKPSQDLSPSVTAVTRGWQPMHSAPMEGEMILLGWWAVGTAGEAPVFYQAVGCWDAKFDSAFDEGESVYRGAWTDYGVASWGYEEYRELQPTCWMDLPEPPVKNSASSPSEASAGNAGLDESSPKQAVLLKALRESPSHD